MRLMTEIGLVIGIGILLITMISCSTPDQTWRGVQRVECGKGLC